MHSDYKILHIAPKVFSALAWMAVVLSVISALAVFAGAAVAETPRWMGLVVLVAGAVYFFIFMTASEGIILLLDMHDNVKSR